MRCAIVARRVCFRRNVERRVKQGLTARPVVFGNAQSLPRAGVYLEGKDVLVDVCEVLSFTKMPEALPGHDIVRLDVVVHLRKKTAPLG